MPTFNRADLIVETLDSIIDQTYLNWECIIVDDGSSDNTSEVVNDFVSKEARIKYYHRPAKRLKGPSSCRNYGIEKANGEFVIFLDSDDLLTKECIQNRLTFAQNNSQYDFWIFKTKIFEKNPLDGNVIFNAKLDEYSDQVYLKLFFEGFYPFHVSSPLWRIKSLKIIGGFDEELIVAEDPDLHIRAFLNRLQSKTDISTEYSSLYRIDFQSRLKSRNDKRLLKKRDNSLLIMFEKFLKEHKASIQLYCLKFFKDELLFNGSTFDITRFYILYIRYNVFNAKQFFLTPVLIIYKILGLDSIKGLGFYSLKKYLY